MIQIKTIRTILVGHFLKNPHKEINGLNSFLIKDPFDRS